MARLIDADELKKDFRLSFGGVSHAVAACEIIDRQPTIDPESLRATSQLVQDIYGGIKCKNCGYCVSIGGKNALHNAKREFRFCYNCGAKLEGQSDGATD